jgi:uncharacterized protein (DUF4415 family)
MTKPKPKPERKLGRPPGEPTEAITVRVPIAVVPFLVNLGDGYAGRGVKRLIEAAVKAAAKTP